MRIRRRNQSGFTIVEMIITTCIIAVLASVAIKEMREYARRATLSEVVLATGPCKTLVTESYPVLDSAPAPGGWGCEEDSAKTRYAAGVQTSDNGVIRVAIRNVDGNVNGRYVYLAPTRVDGTTPMKTPTDLGFGVRSWLCGSDLTFVRASLPANCRSDMSVYSASETFGP